MSRRVAVIGLDCADPNLVFDRWRDDLPNLSALMDRGLWGPLRSVDPPITVPAWSCMLSSRDPGELGIYGFRNRVDHSYDALTTADSRSVKVDRVWDYLSRAGKHNILIGIPQTSPPFPIEGEMVSCFLTGDTRTDEYTYPSDLRKEIEEAVGGTYRVDVENFRSDDRDRILEEIFEMTEQRFTVARHLLDTRDWDFFMMVEIGVDRIHHAFWRFTDPNHPRYEDGHRYNDVVRSYYQYLDDEIGELLERFDDDTVVMVVSDHGAQPMVGAVCINEWMQENGYLTLKEAPDGKTSFSPKLIDWSKTKAWGEGGYYSRIFLNVEGREPEGIVSQDDYDKVRNEIVAGLEALTDPDGEPLNTKVYRPDELWESVDGIPPDLLAYFGNLTWRSNGSVGMGSLWTFENDTGPDDANHAKHGMCIMAGPGLGGGELEDLNILDVTPTILTAFGLEPTPEMQGRPRVADAG